MNDSLQLASPPSWSLAVGEAGKVFVILSAIFFAVSGIAWFLQPKSAPLGLVGKIAFWAANASLLVTFGCLATLFIENRFEFEYVYGHADTKNTVIYRIAGIWSGQEGSFLLWACCTAVFALLTVHKTAQYQRWFSIACAVFQGGIASILAFESPFRLNLMDGKPVVPMEGVGLAPSLQNYWVTIHPPTIFLGFGSLTILFAIAVAALLKNDLDGWVPIVRPWAIISTTLVGVGLAMGGFWAYETLGWGGFWMWDPVENVSFVPWLLGAALVHGLLVQTAKGKWKMGNTLLAAIPFLLFVYGTFLTRSGFLSEASVHSFAEMDRSALKLLTAVLGITTIGFFGIWFYRLFQLRKTAPAAAADSPGLGREWFYLNGNIALVTMSLATAIGMSVPFFMSISGRKSKVVEESLYHQVLPWVFIPLMILMAVTPFAPWRNVRLREIMGKAYSAFCVSIGLTGLLLFAAVMTPFGKKIELNPELTMFGRWQIPGLWWLMALVWLCLFVLVANGWQALSLVKRSKMGVSSFLSHVGVAIMMAGLIISRGFEKKGEGFVLPSNPANVMTYQIAYKGMTSTMEDRNNQLKLDVMDGHTGKVLFQARPGLYHVNMGGEQQTMVWPHIERGFLMDTYVSLGQPQTGLGQDLTLAPGKDAVVDDTVIKYRKMIREGESGMTGTKFGAELEVTRNGKTQILTPRMEIAGQGSVIDLPVAIDKELQISMKGMNAADKSVSLRLSLTDVLYPVEVFHKPMTILVWLGTAILTVAGFMAAIYRRPRKSQATQPEEAPAAEPQEAELVHN